MVGDDAPGGERVDGTEGAGEFESTEWVEGTVWTDAFVTASLEL